MKLLISFLLALCFSVQSNAQQIDSTGNLINNNNWSGAVYGVDPGGCCTSISGSGALYDTNSNTILFSYGSDIVTNTIGLQQALGGTGVLVHGYNFSFDYRLVPNNASQASMDFLHVDIYLTTSAGQNVEYSSYDLSNATMSGLLDSWMSVSNTRTFNQPYLDPQSVSMRIQGYDGGFWAGYYGPEVKNTSLSVNYSFDPCVQDPLYSSSCPGYWDAFLQAFGSFFGFNSSEPEVAVVDYSLPTTVTISAMPEDSTTTEPVVDAGGVEVSTTGELSVPDGIPEVVKEDKEKKSIDPTLLSNILREATDDSAALSIVNQSIQDSMSEDANPDFSMTNETLQAIQQQAELSQQQAMQAQELLLQEQMESSVASIDSLVTEQNIAQGLDITTLDADSSFMDSNDNDKKETRNQNLDTLSVTQTNVQTVVDDNKQNNEAAVNQKAEPNEAAGGVDIASIAVAPADFNNYLNKSIQDALFYEEKEIYAGQTVVDNRRAQRLLNGASDRLHKEMVDQQYRR